jgi:dTDP-4-dehydrorhamnose 3,5-epimerase-like enzyme
MEDVAIVTLEPEHEDDRGRMFKPIDDEDLRAVFHITSEPGVVRANHYHETQTQWLYLVDGGLELSLQDRRGNEAGTTETHRLEPEDLVRIPPQVAHALRIHAPTEFLEFMDHAQGPNGEFYDRDTVDVDLLSP